MYRAISEVSSAAATAAKMDTKSVLAIVGLGLLIVFLVLALLMVIIYITSAFSKKSSTGNEKPAETAAAMSAAITAPVTAPKQPSGPLAPGSCGSIKLFDVPDKTAAMLMAIVADKLGEPLNTLRFISVREVK